MTPRVSSNLTSLLPSQLEDRPMRRKLSDPANHGKEIAGRRKAAQSQNASIDQSGAGRIDKLELVLPLAVFGHHAIEQAARGFGDSGLVKYFSSKSTGYLKNFVLKCPSGASVTFHFEAAKSNMKHGLKIVLNPDHLTAEDTEAMIQCLIRIFPLGAKQMVAALLLNRLDQAFDHPVRMGDLIIQLRGSRTEAKVFVATDRLGEVQTWYCGSPQSPVRWVAYDQNASDEYKRAHGERPSQPAQRSKLEDQAHFIARREGDRTRFEVRRHFPKPLTLQQAEAEARDHPLGVIDAYKLTKSKLDRAPEGFIHYLDSVRLRGVTGARSNSLRLGSSSSLKARKTRLAEFEEFLAGCAAPFWDKAGLDCAIRSAMEKLPVWRAIKMIATSSQ